MQLTQYEQDLLAGTYGKGLQTAMEIVTAFGRLYGADHLIPVNSAHIDAAAYTTIWDSGIDFVEKLEAEGARVAVPTTINTLSRDIRNWASFGISEELSEKSRRLEEAYLKLGVIPTWTCAPYQNTNLPRFGEAVSWSESNAVCFVNSVVGARAERLPDLVDVCCAIAGRVPAYGMYLAENRLGSLLFQLSGFDREAFRDNLVFSLLGYYIGEIAVNRVPVIEGLPKDSSVDRLKALSAALASSGAVSLFHAVGITPEVPSVSSAFGPHPIEQTVVITPEDLSKLHSRLNTASSDHVDLVLLGCPHYSVNEMRTVAELIDGRTVHMGVDFWITTSDTQYRLAERCGIVDTLETAGVRIARDTCVMEMDDGNGRFAGKTFVTDSGKAAQYAPGINRCTIHMATVADCVEAAVTGRIPGR